MGRWPKSRGRYQHFTPGVYWPPTGHDSCCMIWSKFDMFGQTAKWWNSFPDLTLFLRFWLFPRADDGCRSWYVAIGFQLWCGSCYKAQLPSQQSHQSHGKIIEFKPSFLWLRSYVSLVTGVLAFVNFISRGHSWYGASKSLRKRTYWIARNVRDLVASSSIFAVVWCFLMSSTDMSHGCAPQILVGFWVTPPYDRNGARNIQNWCHRLANLFVIIFCYGMSCIGSRICERLWPGIHSCGNEASDSDYDGRTRSNQPCQTSHGCSSGIRWRWADEDGSHAEVEMRTSEVAMANCGGARFRLRWLAIREGHTAQAWTLQVDASGPSSALPTTSAVVRTRFF